MTSDATKQRVLAVHRAAVDKFGPDVTGEQLFTEIVNALPDIDPREAIAVFHEAAAQAFDEADRLEQAMYQKVLEFIPVDGKPN